MRCVAYLFEVVECLQDAAVSTGYEADGSQELQHQHVRPVLLRFLLCDRAVFVGGATERVVDLRYSVQQQRWNMRQTHTGSIPVLASCSTRFTLC